MSEIARLCEKRGPSVASAQRKPKDGGQHPGRSISTLIIGPFGFYSEGLYRILEFNQFNNIIQIQKYQTPNNIDCKTPRLYIFIGISSNSDLVKTVSELRENNSAARIVVLVDDNDPDEFIEAMNIPAQAFLSASISPSALINALEVIFGDGSVLSTKFADYLTSRHRPCETKPVKAAPTEQRLFLSSRETDILRCLTDGISNKHIARQFGIAESTVKVHVKSILRKINVQNRTQAAIWALANCPHPEHIEMAAANPERLLTAAH